MIIDINKTYRTRDGREVRIYATDGFGSHPIHGAINCSGDWISTTWREDGRFYSDMESEDDLIEVKPRIKRTVWLNVSRGHVGCYYDSKEHADSNKTLGAIACLKLELDFEEGEGL
jgi:hypothetical protein